MNQRPKYKTKNYKTCRRKHYKTPRRKCRHNTFLHKSQQHLSQSISRIMEIKAKINKGDLFEFKSFFMAKETMKKMKRQPTDWKKIFANYVTNKGLVSKTYKQLMMLNSIKTNDPLKKMGRRPE